jgi:subtilisin family serine protease
VTSSINDPRNGDNLIFIEFVADPATSPLPSGTTTIELTGTTVMNGTFHAWVGPNNLHGTGYSGRFPSGFKPPHLEEDTRTVGVPGTAHRAITVGNHDETTPTPKINPKSGRGPSRDDRTKPEIATVGVNVTSPRARGANGTGKLYSPRSGTSLSAPLVAGAVACLFECRGQTTMGGATNVTWEDLKQILQNTAAPVPPVPDTAFGFGYMQIGQGCAVHGARTSRTRSPGTRPASATIRARGS